MAQRTIARMYDSYETAAQTVSDLETAGIPHSDISIVSNDAKHRDAVAAGTETHAGSGAGAGASVGTLLGGGAGLLAGIGALAIPGVGPVVAAGWLIATLTGAGIGAAAGGLVGSLTGAGVSEEDANVYGEGVRRGGTLVTVRLDDSMAARAEGIMAQRGPVDVQTRGAEYPSGRLEPVRRDRRALCRVRLGCDRRDLGLDHRPVDRYDHWLDLGHDGRHAHRHDRRGHSPGSAGGLTTAPHG